MSAAEFLNMCHDPRPPGAPRRVWRDWLVLGLAIVGAFVEIVLRSDIVWPALALTAALVALPLLLWRRTYPLLTVALGFGSMTVFSLTAIAFEAAPIGLYAMAALMVLPYSLFRWGSGREATIGLGIMVGTWATSVLADYSGVGDTIGGLIVLLFPVVLGSMVRFQAKARSQEIEQAKSLTREQLARELHDSVAHHVSAIAIQAQGGRAVAATDPTKAADVLGVIEEEAARALTEMRNMVGALRDGTGVDLTPQPGVADIERLSATAGSIDGPVVGNSPTIDVELLGDLNNLRPSVDTALYRLAQESITNSLRHARNASLVRVRVLGDDESVRLTVHDDGIANPPPISSPGFGLVGMAERAKLLGGTLTAGPGGPGRGWTVQAVLPRDGAAA